MRVLLQDRELASYTLLAIADKERTVPERYLYKVRELIQLVGRLDAVIPYPDPWLASELDRLRHSYTGLRAQRL
jgi:hypothetical protein